MSRRAQLLPNLDGVRAAACLMVVASHMPFAAKPDTLGELGVCVFFVLSGFLMGHLYGAADWTARAVLRYGIARFARIAPIYWLVIGVCILISYADPGVAFQLRIEGPVAIARHLLFGGNVFVFWSIPLEVQYYLFFLFVWWCLAHGTQRAYPLALGALVCAGLLLTHNQWTGLMLPHKLHFFLAGTLAGICPRPDWRAGRERALLGLLQLVALAMMALPLWLFATKPELYGASAVGPALAVAVYLLSIPSGWTQRVFANPWARKVGQASFSIYLMHVVVFHFGMAALGLTLKAFHPLWWLLGLAGILLPMVVSHVLEMPLQGLVRRLLERRLLPPVSRPPG